MSPEQRDRCVAKVEDPALRKAAEENPDCLHPCVWLVKDDGGPLEAGGRPKLPVGREWPRVEGKPLVYLLSIDAAQLPEWSPLPRDAGRLLLFVGHTTCEIVMAPRGAETYEAEPPLEDYLSGSPPIAGDVLEVMRFRLEEGVHAGVPASWSPAQGEAPDLDYEAVDELSELNRALQPEGYFGRLFGYHECWTSVDAASITRYAYLDAHGYPGGWYADLDGHVYELQEELERAKLQPPVTVEPVPGLAPAVVEACERWAAEAERKVAERQGLRAAVVREKVENARVTLGRRLERWRRAKAGDPAAANKALEELLAAAGEIDHEMEHTPNTDDPVEFKAQLAAIEAGDEERSRQWSQRAMAEMQEEVRIRKEYATDLAALDAAMKAFEQSKDQAKSAYAKVVAALTPMQYACQKSDLDAIRKTWREYEDQLNEHASQLRASSLATFLMWRLRGFESLQGWSRRGWVNPTAIAKRIEAIQWWQADARRHMAELGHWRPLLVMDSDDGPYFWGDAGWAIILADGREVAKASLGRLAIAVDVS